MMRGRDDLESIGTGMEFLAHVLSRQLSGTVLNKTGLTGNWDYKLDWTPDDTSLPISKGSDG
jgi:uncharacterized protein (TIGR03435 family)